MSIPSLIKTARDTFAKPSRTIGPKEEFADINFQLTENSLPYATINSNWFKAPPYGFRFRNRRGEEAIILLPISPQNLTITTHYAINVITTLYGTVEEHSEQRYFDIAIEGTTGIAPRYNAVIDGGSTDQLKSISSDGRTSYADGDAMRLSIGANIAGGFFSQTIGVVNQVLGNAQELISGKEALNVTGIDVNSSTGYAAFHRLYKFFLAYQADTAGINMSNNSQQSAIRRAEAGQDSHPLAFLNYKDNNEYSCAIQSFSLRRSIQNPMLYNYSIVLRAYNLREIQDLQPDVGDLSDRLDSLGLSGVESSTLLSEVSDVAKNVRLTAGAFLGGFDIIGR